ncbi:MAG: NAD(P)H-hydrate dehydratase [Planctomycetota bacterium]
MTRRDLAWIERVPPCPDRPGAGHKGTFGTVVVVGGSGLMVGAPALCATAALRSGAGLVKVAGELPWLRDVLTLQASATGLERHQLHAAGEDEEAVLAVGPGLGVTPETEELVRRLIDGQRSVVWDADGLNLLARVGTMGRRDDPRTASAEWVLTPHPGEFRRLAEAFGVAGDPTDPEERPAAAAGLAAATAGVVVLKGRHTVVTDGRRAYRNLTGSPALATAGTGDVLTGLIAGLMAQGLPGFEAAVLGAYLHGDAGDHWARRHGGSGLLAMDLAHALPEAFERCRARGREGSGSGGGFGGNSEG